MAAVAARLPLPAFIRVLDICCGSGRHAARLTERGYRVTGIDRDQAAVASAQARAPGAAFQRLDMREIGSLPGTFDAALILWQSFGYFAPDENDQVLGSVRGRLRPGGRLLLDVFHPEYFRHRRGRRTQLPEGVSAIDDLLQGHRLTSTITYNDGSRELMDFEVFAPDELVARAANAGFALVEACCWWDGARSPDPLEPRYQLILERSPS